LSFKDLKFEKPESRQTSAFQAGGDTTIKIMRRSAATQKISISEQRTVVIWPWLAGTPIFL
jgi:hypothetical protein